MDADALIEATVATWRRHQELLLYLIDEIPRGGLACLPAGSRGRTVGAQLLHLHRVRLGWLYVHEHGERPKIERYDQHKPPTKVQLRKQLKESGKAVEAWLGAALRGEAKVRQFGRNPVRWMGYLIAHESHHRGQILIALKQSGKRLPEDVAVQGLWGRWIMGA